MARVLELDELVEHFTLLPDEQALLRNEFGATRLGFALMLKFFVWVGRFPSGRSEFGDEVVGFVAGQVGVPAGELGFYDWSGRTMVCPENFGPVDVGPFMRSVEIQSTR